MFDARVKMTMKRDFRAMQQLTDAFKYLQEEDVLVGIPMEKSSTYASGVTNVELMYIHTHGSPVNGIPARPTIEPAISKPENRRVLQGLLRDSMKSALMGNIPGARAQKQKAGMMAVSYAKEMFGSGELAPNHPSTIKQKGSSAPLIDTGQLRNSITFVIRRK